MGVQERIVFVLEAITDKFNTSIAVNKLRLKNATKAFRAFNNVMHMSIDDWVNLNRMANMSAEGFLNFAKKMDPGFLEEYGLKLNQLKQNLLKATPKKQTLLRQMYEAMPDMLDSITDKAVSLEDAQKRMIEPLNKKGGRLANNIRRLTHGMNKLRMEMLGVMFFGMSMKRLFSGLLAPIMEVYGVFDLFRLMLIVLFQPIMDILFPILLKVMTWFMSLSPESKKAIGAMVLFGLVLGVVLAVVGALAVGLGAIIVAFTRLFSPLGLILGLLFALVGVPLLKRLFGGSTKEADDTTESLENVGDASNDTAETLIENTQTIQDSMTEMFNEIDDAMKYSTTSINTMSTGATEATDTLAANVEDSSESIKDTFSTLWDDVKLDMDDFLPDLKIFGGDMGTNIIDGIKDKFPTLGETIEDIITTVEDIIGGEDAITSLFDLGFDILTNIINGINDNMDTITTVLTTFLGKFGSWLGDNLLTIIKVGVDFGSALVSGILEGILNTFDNAGQKIGDVLREMFGLGTFRSVENLEDIMGSSLPYKSKIKLAKELYDNRRWEYPAWLEDRINAYGLNKSKPSTSSYSYYSSSKSPYLNDFIWRSGQGAIRINPHDNVIGYKGSSPTGMGGVTIAPTYNISVSDKDMLMKEIEYSNKRLVEEIRRVSRQ